jgi:glycerol-3-phosphate dehydrogenase (NAD(P)+)
MKPVVGVVGAGNWGTTLAKVIGGNERQTLLWAREPEVRQSVAEAHENTMFLPGYRLPDTVRPTGDLREICELCDLIFMVVPSHVFRGVARIMGEHLQGDQMVVHCTKGIEIDTFKRMSEVLREETCLRKVGVLAGPNLAKELAEQKPAGTLVASKYPEVQRAAQDVLNNRYFRVYAGHDVVGAEVGGSFKNIVAVAAGICDGLHMGDNTKALLLTRSLNEMARLGTVMGADLVTFGGMAGIGDLMATCASPLSRNHQVGERLAQGQTLEQIQASMLMVAEGVKTAKAVHGFARRHDLELPIVRAVYQLLYEGVSVAEAVERLMSRVVGHEFPPQLLVAATVKP